MVGHMAGLLAKAVRISKRSMRTRPTDPTFSEGPIPTRRVRPTDPLSGSAADSPCPTDRPTFWVSRRLAVSDRPTLWGCRWAVADPENPTDRP